MAGYPEGKVICRQDLPVGELWGQAARNFYYSDIPKVKAYWGPLPLGAQGFEFTAPVRPDYGPVVGSGSTPLGHALLDRAATGGNNRGGIRKGQNIAG